MMQKAITEPEISVGIVSALHITFTLDGRYQAKGESLEGEQQVTFDEGGIRWQNDVYHELTFVPQTPDASFALHEVVIGINFHWERTETQRFRGSLRLVVNEGKITAINLLPAEEYLVSVISSEMNATSSPEFLKAHAVISRSWLLAQIEKRKQLGRQAQHSLSLLKSPTEYLRWYDREDHTIFDVCADDHCQRYQGITRASNPAVAQAVAATHGEVLMYGGTICDARFSKCCGGATEVFGTCWENKDYPYLQALRDAEGDKPLPDLTDEKTADRWIHSSPEAFCNTRDEHILSQILNHYDRETTDFYRWSVHYTQQELSLLIHRNTRTDYGQIIDLLPLERGKSGRIYKLKIVGTLKTLIIGKELEIRRVLSHTHLFSSAFTVEKGEPEEGVPAWFTLTGAGWGHGVGLCQIGAAVMGERGYDYRRILQHYYPHTDIVKRY